MVMDFPAGLNVREIVTVESPEHLADVVLNASRHDMPVIPVGGGTYLSTGISTEHEYLLLDLSPLNGVENYIPTDMTASFRAGTPVVDVRAALAANGQELSVDLPADDAGTIGGLVATGYAGARRLGQGTFKDLLIGCEYVRGDGLIAKAGGMTVKNVSGFEISRLLHGSWGSLAVLTRVNLKVLPIPREDRTFTWHDTGLQAALDRQLRLLSGFPACVALETSGQRGNFSTSIRFVGRESAIADYEQQVNSAGEKPDEAHQGDAGWISMAATEVTPYFVASNSLERSRELALTLNATEGIESLSISLALGTVRARIAPDLVRATDLADIATGLWMIEGGHPEWKAGMNSWGPQQGDHGVAMAVKQQFDPACILNRGRLFI
jgi:glycolate oxidase FAD binding subunit